MFTIKSFTDVVNKELRSRIVTVTFTDGTNDLTQPFRFSIGTDDSSVKRTVKQFLGELNAVHTPITGDIADYVEPTPTPPTQAGLDKIEWFRDFDRLKKVQELIALGVIAANLPAVVTLKTKVTNNFKAAYIADM